MVKLIITDRQFNVIKEHLSEEIDPSEAYKDEGSIGTILSGKRNVGFLAVYYDKHKKLLEKAIENGLEYISIPQEGGMFKNSIAYVIYRAEAEDEAYKLAKIARDNRGYLPTNTPEETYEIGILLGYNPDKVREFVLNKFPDFKF